MTQEEKAKAYDKAKYIMKEYLESGNAGVIAENTIRKAFPELTESEDEKIRKAIEYAIGQSTHSDGTLINGVSSEEALAWLEKQGEHNKFRDHIQIGDKVTRNEDGMLVNLSQLKRVAKKDEKQGEPTEINPSEFDLRLNRLLKQFETLPKEELASSLSFYINVVQNNGTYKEEKQGKQETLCDKCRIEHPSHSCQDITELGRCAVEHEQKPVDKVEPKFKVGDWVVYDHRPYQIVELPKEGYINLGLRGNGNGKIEFAPSTYCRHWNIQDAKDGDVLYLQKDGKEHIIIYKGVLKERFRTFVSAYCAYNGIVDAFCFADVSKYVDIAYRGIMPATKEQRDILFARMKEAGYEWDAEKKELKKIEERIADNIPQAFEKYVEHLLSLSDGEGHGSPAKVKDVSAELFKLAKLEQKHLWSEEDENRINRLIAYFEDKESFTAEDDVVYAKWLNSLKERYTWKPSDEQMDMLKIAVSTSNSIVLDSLYNDLMKLKE